MCVNNMIWWRLVCELVLLYPDTQAQLNFCDWHRNMPSILKSNRYSAIQVYTLHTLLKLDDSKLWILRLERQRVSEADLSRWSTQSLSAF